MASRDPAPPERKKFDVESYSEEEKALLAESKRNIWTASGVCGAATFAALRFVTRNKPHSPLRR